MSKKEKWFTGKSLEFSQNHEKIQPNSSQNVVWKYPGTRRSFSGGSPSQNCCCDNTETPPLPHMLFSLEFSCRVTWLAKPALLWQPMECVLVYSCVLKNFSAFISGAININRCSSYNQGTLESLVTFKTGRKSKSKRFDNPCSGSSNKVHG